jgi:hypothetical protein
LPTLRNSNIGGYYNIQNALYFPAKVACRYNPIMKETYNRINQKKASKIIGPGATQKNTFFIKLLAF